MPDRGTVIYAYDGSFEGLLCCVFESFDRHELPPAILPEDEAARTLFPVRSLPTDRAKAERVLASIPKKLGPDAYDLVKTGFLYGLEGKELAILRFLRLAYRVGPRAVDMLGDADVSALHHMVRAVRNEAHLQLEFLRFSERGGCLFAAIDAKHYVLPLMEGHFSSRFPEERFLIWDRAHGMALLYQPYEARMVEADQIEFDGPGDEELDYQLLWKHYYDSVGIQQRANPRCRMGHLPKRYWPNLPELNGSPLRLEQAREARRLAAKREGGDASAVFLSPQTEKSLFPAKKEQ